MRVFPCAQVLLDGAYHCKVPSYSTSFPFLSLLEKKSQSISAILNLHEHLIFGLFQVSDFGMSTALVGDDINEDYAANYVKMGGELPVRWSAIEVLKDGKYSKASDV